MDHKSNTNLPNIIGASDTQLIRWVESGERLDSFGHGVQFLHGVRRKRVVAFLEGFEWLHRPGSPATVRILSIRPSSITANRWAAIIRSVREGIPAFLSDKGNLGYSFRHGPIHILING